MLHAEANYIYEILIRLQNRSLQQIGHKLWKRIVRYSKRNKCQVELHPEKKLS